MNQKKKKNSLCVVNVFNDVCVFAGTEWEKRGKNDIVLSCSVVTQRQASYIHTASMAIYGDWVKTAAHLIENDFWSIREKGVKKISGGQKEGREGYMKKEICFINNIDQYGSNFHLDGVEF